MEIKILKSNKINVNITQKQLIIKMTTKIFINIT